MVGFWGPGKRETKRKLQYKIWCLLKQLDNYKNPFPKAEAMPCNVKDGAISKCPPEKKIKNCSDENLRGDF